MPRKSHRVAIAAAMVAAWAIIVYNTGCTHAAPGMKIGACTIATAWAMVGLWAVSQAHSRKEDTSDERHP